MRHFRKLSKIIPAVALAVAAAEARAQLVYEPFAYGTGSVGQDLSKQGANFSDGGFTNPQNGQKWFAAANTFSGFIPLSSGDVSGPSGGTPTYGSEGVTNTGGVVNRDARLQPAGLGLKTGAAYYSFNLNVSDITALPFNTAGAFLAGFNNGNGTQTGTAGTIGARLAIRRDQSDSTKFNLGVDNASSRTFDGTVAYSINTPLFIVGKLDLNANPDVGSIWVNPASTTFGAGDAPAPTISVGQDFAAGVNSQIGSFIIRTDNAAVPSFQLDEVRVDTSWAQVTPPTGNTWIGANGDSWTDGTKWSTTSAPNAGGAFVNLTGAGGTINLPSSQTIGTMTIKTTSSYVVSGAGTLSFDGNRPATADASGTGDINLLVNTDPTTGAVLTSSHEIKSNINIVNTGTADQGAFTANIGGGQTLTLSGVVSATNAAAIFAKSGAGTLVLSGNNTYAGGVRVIGGSLQANSDLALGAAPGSPQTNIRLRTGGSLKFGSAFTLNPNRTILIEDYTNNFFANQGTIDTNGFDVTVGSQITTSDGTGGTLIKAGAGTLTLTNASNGQFTNIVQGGTLSIDSNAELGNTTGSLTISNNATVKVTNPMSWAHGVVLGGSGGGNVDTGANNLTFTGAISGSNNQLSKLGAGMLVLTAASPNFVNGPLNINNGVVQIAPGNVNALQQATVNIAVNNGLDLNGNDAQLGGLSGTGSLLFAGNPSVGNNSQNTTFSGATSGTGGLTKVGSGSLTLSGTQGYTGPTTVTLGKLVLAANLTTSPSVTVNDQLELAIGGGSNRILRTPTLTVGAAGKVNVQDNKIILTNMPAGSWNGANYTDVTGLVATGKGTSNTWNGANGIITTQSDAVGSNRTSIGVAKASDVRPATATATALWAGQTITGTDTLVMYTYGGDANLDGKINIDDYVRIDQGIAGNKTGWSNGDFNYDGKVNIDDYTTIIDNNVGGQGAPFPTAGGIGVGEGVVAVPEPAALGLLGLGAVTLLSRRRRAARG